MRYFDPIGRVISFAGVDRGTPRLSVPRLVAAGAPVLVVFGSTRTWARISGERFVGDAVDVLSVNGTAGDGVATLLLGAVAGVLFLWRLVRPYASGFLPGTAIVALMIVAVVGMLNWLDAAHMPGVDQHGKYFRTGVQAGWGLIVLTLAAGAGAVALAYQIYYDELRWRRPAFLRRPR